MCVTKHERTIFPQTNQGQRMAKELVERLKRLAASTNMREGTQCITVEATYYFEIEDDKSEDKND